jgi:type VI secretion system secreted protein VgrG
MPDLKQAERCLEIKTPLGDNKLVMQSLEIEEGISSLFRLNATLLSEDHNIALKDLVGQKVSVRISTPGPSRKHQHFHGFVSRFAEGGKDNRVRTYYVEVVPWLWFLTQTADLRIFQKKSVPDIIQQIFKDLGFSDFKLQLQGNFEPREYCVQYRESDFAFVSRLMEEEGMFYFFEHTEDKHTLVIANSPDAHKAAPGFDKYRYVPKGGEDKEAGGIDSWQLGQSFRSGKYALNDYHFLTPQNDQKVSAPTAVKVGGNDKFEVYDYPGAYAKRFDGDDKMGKVRPDGERTNKLYMQEIEARHKESYGLCSLIGMRSGCKFELTEFDRADFNGPYVLTQVQHVATQNPYASGGESHETYQCSFTCIPLAVPYRPRRATPKPVVHGVQTAVVVGLKGEEIDTDKYGRVKVQFHWDREGKKDENSSCWVRVASMWAGAQWGMINIPRIGQEVIVAFLEGDPDQPIIVGSVYNALNMPPYILPDNKTQSGVVTRSSKEGDAEEFSEIRFEDKKGEEYVYIRSQKDLIEAAENDELNWVGNDRWVEVENNDTLIIYKGDREVTLEEGNDKLEIKKGNRTVQVATGNYANSVKMGKYSLEACQEIELKVGGSTIKISPAKIEITSPEIAITGNAKAAMTAPMTEVTGSAACTISGGIVKIN